MSPIHFGTSGWRDLIAAGFTFTGVTAVTRAVARRLKAQRIAGRGVLVGHDPRFLSEQFTALAARILSEEGIRVHVVEESAPTPVLAAAILDLKLAGGINFTASHNPAEYQGFKWSNAHGSPATREEVAPLEKLAAKFLAQGGGRAPRGGRRGKILPLDPKPGYFQRLDRMLPLDVIRSAKLAVVADPLYGAGRGYLEEALRRAGCRVSVLHDWRDPLFGGHPPEPSSERLQEARDRMRAERASLVLSTDGDADRFGVLDADGTYLTPNEILALTVYLLVKHRGLKGRVVRSVVTSHLVDAVAGAYGLEVEVTPVGFKYIGESMQRGGFLAGGEESGGLTVAGHVPEKDGVLACLLMAELVARERRSLRAVLDDLFSRVGRILTQRVNVKLATQEAGAALKKKLQHYHPKQLAGRAVKQVDTLDGFKYLLEGGAWLAIRLSGTEPVARLYLEANDPALLETLAAVGRKLLVGR
ncbi:MAG: phosphoglucomutase/phosphomannomutase family protein [candidate division FCPU426 bacterium]